MRKVYTTILVESEKTHVIKRWRFIERAFCPDCGCRVSFLPPFDAAALICRDLETVSWWAATGKVHFRYLDPNRFVVCLTSLCLADRPE